jgi:type II secretory pathway pseudopilin PulG
MSQQINLFNPLFRKKSFSFTSALAMAYSAGAVVAIMALAGAYTSSQLRATQARAQALDLAFKDANANFDKLAAEVAKQKPNPRLQAEVATRELQLVERQDVVDSLKNGTLGNAEGFSDYLRAFSRQSVSGLWITAFDIGSGNALALQGRTLSAEHVATYLQRLNKEKALQGRQFASMRISQPPPEPRVVEKAVPGQSSSVKEQPAVPRYLEFTISTLDIPEGTPSNAKSSSLEAPLLGPLNSAAVLEPAKAGAR